MLEERILACLFNDIISDLFGVDISIEFVQYGRAAKAFGNFKLEYRSCFIEIIDDYISISCHATLENGLVVSSIKRCELADPDLSANLCSLLKNWLRPDLNG